MREKAKLNEDGSWDKGEVVNLKKPETCTVCSDDCHYAAKWAEATIEKQKKKLDRPGTIFMNESNKQYNNRQMDAVSGDRKPVTGPTVCMRCGHGKDLQDAVVLENNGQITRLIFCPDCHEVWMRWANDCRRQKMEEHPTDMGKDKAAAALKEKVVEKKEEEQPADRFLRECRELDMDKKLAELVGDDKSAAAAKEKAEQCMAILNEEYKKAVLASMKSSQEESAEVETPQKEKNDEPVGYYSSKQDRGKLRLDLIPVEWLEVLAEIFTHGAKEYGENTWPNVPDGEKRYYAALLRHLVEARKSGGVDPEDELPLWAKVAWNALALYSLEVKNGNANS